MSNINPPRKGRAIGEIPDGAFLLNNASTPGFQLNRAMFGLAAAAFALLSCSLLQRGTEPADIGQTVAPTVEAAVEVTQEPEEESSQSARPPLVCEDPPAQEIGIGQPISGEIDDPVWIRCYWVQLPAGLDQVSFELSGLEADLSMEMGYGYLITVQSNVGEFWDSRQPETSDEIVTLGGPKAGPYFIKVQPAGPRVASPFELTVRTQPEQTSAATGAALPESGSCGGPAVELELGETLSGQINGRAERPLNRAYYCLQLPEGLAALTIQVDLASESVDVFVRKDRPAEWYDRDRSDDQREIVIENPAAGAYYISLEASSTGVSPEFSITTSAE